MKKWLILLIFIVGTTLFFNVNFDKIKVNGNSEENYKVYYDAFKGSALNETTNTVKETLNSLNNITSIFGNIWNFILRITNNNGNVITNISEIQGSAYISQFSNIQKQQILFTEIFIFEINLTGSQFVTIGKNQLVGTGAGVEYIKGYDLLAVNYLLELNWKKDYAISVYNNNISGTYYIQMRKEDIWALNDIDLIIIPFEKISIYEDLQKTFKNVIDNDINDISDKLKELGLNHWLISNVDENKLGIIGSWVQN